MDNSSKSCWCCLLFCIFCCYPYMLRLNLMNYFASVRYCNLCCTAGLSETEVLHWQRTLKTCGGHPFIPEEQNSLESASLEHSYFCVHYPKRMLFMFNQTYPLSLTDLLYFSFSLGIIYIYISKCPNVILVVFREIASSEGMIT